MSCVSIVTCFSLHGLRLERGWNGKNIFLAQRCMSDSQLGNQSPDKVPDDGCWDRVHSALLTQAHDQLRNVLSKMEVTLIVVINAGDATLKKTVRISNQISAASKKVVLVAHEDVAALLLSEYSWQGETEIVPVGVKMCDYLNSRLGLEQKSG